MNSRKPDREGLIRLLKNPEQLWEAFRKSKEQFADLTSPPELDRRILDALDKDRSQDHRRPQAATSSSQQFKLAASSEKANTTGSDWVWFVSVADEAYQIFEDCATKVFLLRGRVPRGCSRINFHGEIFLLAPAIGYGSNEFEIVGLGPLRCRSFERRYASGTDRFVISFE